MLSLPKLFALAGIVWLVFYFFRSVEARRKSGKNTANSDQSGSRSNRDNAAGEAKNAKPNQLDLEECSLCGAWVAGQPCDREECPYSRP